MGRTTVTERVKGKALNRAETADLARRIGEMLALVRDGEMMASTTMVHRLEGALTALEAVTGESSSLLDLLEGSSHSQLD